MTIAFEILQDAEKQIRTDGADLNRDNAGESGHRVLRFAEGSARYSRRT